eukprot:CAMPEP_0170175530 /NCGR_PEP_ID=MMETSP0040_2-20121228/8596_1 /TAXON_ID=641309 /ORGANISM="Lotharella oceanica, Strain CCMP622" /LENGTH=57 /DNA_ID=CAMNT_0010417549 /DNA_START=78 /DNA_END=252 /DNA_ORIENTATION=+
MRMMLRGCGVADARPTLSLRGGGGGHDAVQNEAAEGSRETGCAAAADDAGGPADVSA